VHNVFILPIEPVESRYSAEWFRFVPRQLLEHAQNVDRKTCIRNLGQVKQVTGAKVTNKVPPGQFLDWAATNIYKSTQLAKLAKMFQDGAIKNGDKIVITDAWNPVVLQIRYMIDLMELNVELHGLWHAGSYDETDILGFTIKDKRWSYGAERAMYYAYDKNYFASAYHLSLFEKILGIQPEPRSKNTRSYVVGWPMEYLKDLKLYNSKYPKKKENVILFPHRLNSDKQPWLFKDLRDTLETKIDYRFVCTQELGLDKRAYHELMQRSEFVFSCSLHENLGISMYEGTLHGAIPLMPNRLSYREMYHKDFLYPSVWTSDENSYRRNKQKLCDWIVHAVKTKEIMRHKMELYQPHLDKFFNGEALYSHLI
jgi:hypothetical protein